VTVGNPIRMVGVREARAALRSVVEQVVEGGPVAIMDRSQPVAVLLRFDEADRWERIARGLAALHALDIFPELVRADAELPQMVRGGLTPSDAAIGRLIRLRQEILIPPSYVGLADVRVKFATILEQAMKGRPVMIVSYSRPRAILISHREYRRLTTLSRAIAWFQNRGIDLASAQPEDVAAWVTAFRDERPAIAEDAAGA
jgi:prevent-host-death family protein